MPDGWVRAQALYDWSALTEKLDCMLSEIYGYASASRISGYGGRGRTNALSARAMGLYVECSGLISFCRPGNSEAFRRKSWKHFMRKSRSC